MTGIRILCVVFTCAIGLAAQHPTLDVLEIDSTAREALASHMEKSAISPEAYVLSKLRGHDLVFLGEVHLTRVYPQFVARLVPALHAEGVVLASEFLRSRQQAEVDRILLAPKWDEAAAIDLLRDLPLATWGFREYLAVLEAGWRTNSKRAAGKDAFRIVGIDSDWNQLELWSSDRRAAFDMTLARERHLTGRIREMAFEKGHKVLVHIGWAHTARFNGVRAGAVLYGEQPGKVFQIVLHNRISKSFVEVVEPILAQGPAAGFGLDLEGSAWGALSDRKSQAFRLGGGRLEKLAQGYVYLKPLADLGRVSWIEGFVTAKRFDEARAVAMRLKLVPKDSTVESPAQLDALLQRRYPPPQPVPDRR